MSLIIKHLMIILPTGYWLRLGEKLVGEIAHVIHENYTCTTNQSSYHLR